MPINVSQISLQDIQNIRSEKKLPYFNFVQESINAGLAYTLGDDGYFIVAPERSLLPRFVLELKVPKKGDIDSYRELSFILNDKSCGMMWFDQEDIDANDFVWRLNLPVKLGSPMFAWNWNNTLPEEKAQNCVLKLVDGNSTATAKDLMTGFPQNMGGLTAEEFKYHESKGRIVSLELDSSIQGAALLVPQGNYCTVTISLNPEQKSKGLGKEFMRLISEHLKDKKLTPVVGMSSDSPQTYLGCLSLQMNMINRGYKCLLGNIF